MLHNIQCFQPGYSLLIATHHFSSFRIAPHRSSSLLIVLIESRSFNESPLCYYANYPHDMQRLLDDAVGQRVETAQDSTANDGSSNDFP